MVHAMKFQVHEWGLVPTLPNTGPQEVVGQLLLTFIGQFRPVSEPKVEHDVALWAVRDHLIENLNDPSFTRDTVQLGPPVMTPSSDVSSDAWWLTQTGGQDRLAQLGSTDPQYEYPRFDLRYVVLRDGEDLFGRVLLMERAKRVLQRTWTVDIPVNLD